MQNRAKVVKKFGLTKYFLYFCTRNEKCSYSSHRIKL